MSFTNFGKIAFTCTFHYKHNNVQMFKSSDSTNDRISQKKVNPHIITVRTLCCICYVGLKEIGKYPVVATRSFGLSDHATSVYSVLPHPGTNFLNIASNFRIYFFSKWKNKQNQPKSIGPADHRCPG